MALMNKKQQMAFAKNHLGLAKSSYMNLLKAVRELCPDIAITSYVNISMLEKNWKK